jgi:two-component system sensor histidine kinase KdpD
VAASWKREWRRHILRAVAAAAALAAVSAVVYGLRGIAPVLSLGVLYLFAVLPVAVFAGFSYALAVSIASLLVFNFFFLPPLHTFQLRDSENWVARLVAVSGEGNRCRAAARARRRLASLR